MFCSVFNTTKKRKPFYKKKKERKKERKREREKERERKREKKREKKRKKEREKKRVFFTCFHAFSVLFFPLGYIVKQIHSEKEHF